MDEVARFSFVLKASASTDFIAVSSTVLRHGHHHRNHHSNRSQLPVGPLLSPSSPRRSVADLTVERCSSRPLHVFAFVRSLKRLRRYDPLDPHFLKTRPGVSPQALLIHYNSRPNLSYPSFPSPSDASLPVSPSSASLPPSPPPELLAELAQLREWEQKGEKLFRKKLLAMRLVLATLLGPLLVFALVVLAGLERTPLSGRWRVLLISPEEEELIHQALLETGYVHRVLTRCRVLR